MATKDKSFISQILSYLTPRSDKDTDKTFKPEININSQNNIDRLSSSISPKVLKENIFEKKDGSSDKVNIQSKLEGITKEIKASVEESITNESILNYFPDVNAAKGIMIDSILSPNNLKRESMTITVDTNVTTDETIISNITKLLNKYFIKEMKLDDKLETWLEKIIYIDGALGLATIPVSSENILNDMKVSLESKEKSISNHSVFGVSELFKPKTYKEFEEQYTTIESNRINFIKETENVKNINPTKFKKETQYTPLVEIIDNPDILFVSQEKKKENKKELKNKMKNFYSNNILFFNESDVDKNTTLLNLEIEKCAIIPIHALGSSDIEYTGFFIILNENNMPIKKKEINNTIELKHVPGVFDDIFKSYNINDLQNYSNLSNIKPEDIYKDILLEYINQGLSIKDLGYISKNIDSTICKYLFFNNLKKKKIKFLYLPAEFLTYFAFYYDNNNVGISILTKLKNSLEQYMTLKVCNILAAYDNAISKKLITVNGNDESFLSNVNDIPALLNTIQQAYIDKNTPKFSISPSVISTGAVKSSIAVKVTGLRGGFDIASENVSAQHNQVDNELFENIRREVITGLDVPPSALNALGEHEYSRSVASSSILFANKIEKKQMIVKSLLSKYIQNVIRFDKNLLTELTSVVDGFKVSDIIKDIRVHLPKPHSVYVESNANVIRNIVDNAEQLGNNLYPNALSGADEKLSETLDLQRALYVRDYIINNLEEIGINIPSGLEDIVAIQDFIMRLKNMSFGISVKLKEDEVQPDDRPLSSPGGYDYNQPSGPGSNDQPGDTEETPPDETSPTDDTGTAGDEPPSPNDEVIL